MKRKAVIKKLRDEAKRQGKTFEVVELTRHTGITVGGTRSTLGRHSEIDETTVKKFYAQFTVELGRGWYR